MWYMKYRIVRSLLLQREYAAQMTHSYFNAFFVSNSFKTPLYRPFFLPLGVAIFKTSLCEGKVGNITTALLWRNWDLFSNVFHCSVILWSMPPSSPMWNKVHFWLWKPQNYLIFPKPNKWSKNVDFASVSSQTWAA